MNMNTEQNQVIASQPGPIASVEADEDGWHEHYLGGVLSACFLFD